MHKGFKCLEPSIGRVYISCDVVFDESIFPFSQLHPNAGALLHKEILLLPSHLCNPGDENCTNLMSTDDGLETGDVQEKSDANWGQHGGFSPSAATPTTEDPGVRSQGDLLIAPGARSRVDLPSASAPVGVSPASTRGGLSPAHSPAPTDSPRANAPSPRGGASAAQLPTTTPPVSPGSSTAPGSGAASS